MTFWVGDIWGSIQLEDNFHELIFIKELLDRETLDACFVPIGSSSAV